MDTLFDYAESEAAKTEGMDAAADNAPNSLQRAREMAREIAEINGGECDSDLVGSAMESAGISVGPWCGSIFKGSQWRFTGRRRQSSRKSNHGREIKIWRLTDQTS